MKKITTMFLLFVSISFSQVFWEETNGPFSGKVSSITICPDGDIFATAIKYTQNPRVTTQLGLVYSNDNGKTWIKINNNNSTEIDYSVTSDSDGNIYVSSEYWSTGYIYDYSLKRSNDKGNSWTYYDITYNNITYRPNVVHLSRNGVLFLASKDHGVFRAQNNLEKLQAINSGLPNENIKCFASNENSDIFAGSQSGVYRSTDDGNNWIKINSGLTGTNVISIGVSPDGIVFVATLDSGIFRSENNGDSWISANSGLTTTDIKSFVFSQNGDVLVGTFGAGVFRSTNDGEQWAQINYGLTDNFINSMSVNFSGDIFTSNNFGGIYKSSNNGDNWIQVGLLFPEITSLAINSNNDLFAAIFGYGIARSSDNGNKWELINPGLTIPYINTISISPSGDIFASAAYSPEVASGGIFKSTNNGNNWSFSGLWGGNVSGISAGQNGKIFARTSGGGVFRSLDNGDNWESTSMNSGSPRSITIASTGIVFVSDGTGTFRSLDDGNNWQKINDNVFTNIAEAPNGDIYGIKYQHILHSKDNGSTWTDNKMPDYITSTLAFNKKGYIFSGPYYSTDEGNSWIPVTSGFPENSNITALAVDTNGYVFAGTTALAGVYRTINSITSVEHNNNEIPINFMLFQNYPNPFNQSTIINYSLPTYSFVVIKIFDVLGKEIKTLVNEKKSAGDFSVEFDADDLSSGIYFCKMRSGTFTSTKKILLMK